MERTPEYDKLVIAAIPKLTRFAKSLTKNHIAAEDLLHTVLEKAFTKYEQFQEGTNLDAWLTTIMRNEYLSSLRRKKREVEDPDGIHASFVAVDGNQTHAYDLKVVTKRMRFAPKNMRLAFELVVINELQYDEAAIVLGVAAGTVKSRVSRMRDYLETGETITEEVDFEEKPKPNEEVIEKVRESYIKGGTVYSIAEEHSMDRMEVMSALLTGRIKKRLQIAFVDADILDEEEEELA